MAAKKDLYIGAELDFATEQLEGWRRYMEANPIELIEDRWGKKEMPKGGFAMVVTSTREQQIKCVQDTMEKYLRLCEVVNKLREAEEAKKTEARGRQEVTLFEGGKI